MSAILCAVCHTYPAMPNNKGRCDDCGTGGRDMAAIMAGVRDMPEATDAVRITRRAPRADR